MEKDTKQSEVASRRPHYYGDLVRKELFFAGFIIMAAALLDSELRNFYLFVGLFGIVGFTILAGLTSRSNRSVIFTDVMVSAVMFLFFEYFAVVRYVQYEDFFEPVFFLRQLASVVFLVTLYYSTKTLRYHDKSQL